MPRGQRPGDELVGRTDGAGVAGRSAAGCVREGGRGSRTVGDGATACLQDGTTRGRQTVDLGVEL